MNSKIRYRYDALGHAFFVTGILYVTRIIIKDTVHVYVYDLKVGPIRTY